ncbi:MAG: RodZ domain-containing protein [Pseudomonadota bacterium]
MSDAKSENKMALSDTGTVEADEQPVELTVGARLSQAREALALELRDVADKTKQSQDTLAALESMETAHIPASIVRLQAKSYARFLGLPEEEIASGYAEGRGSTNASAMPNEVMAPQRSRKTMILGGAAVALVVILAGGATLLFQDSGSETTDPLAISARLSPAYAAVSDIDEFAAPTREDFAIQAKKRAWIEVRGSDGTVFRNREMAAGETYFPRTGAGWTITVRDAGAFDWQLGNLAVEAIGEDQQALYSVSVDAALASAIAARSAALAEAPGGREQRR